MRTPLAAVIVGLALAPGLIAVSPGDPRDTSVVDVREHQGVYSVEARFVVSQPPAVVVAVLTDYEQIPRYMPDVKKSVVQARTASGAVIEQEAVSKMMMFSKRVHLLLEIEEGQTTIRFRDTCGRSFESYDGSWTLTDDKGRTVVSYNLTAKPTFAVPEFMLKRCTSARRRSDDRTPSARDLTASVISAEDASLPHTSPWTGTTWHRPSKRRCTRRNSFSSTQAPDFKTFQEASPSGTFDSRVTSAAPGQADRTQR